MKNRNSAGPSLAKKEKSILDFFRRHISEEWAEFISFYRRIQHYKKGEVIIRENDPVEGMHIIIEGKVKVVSSYGKKEERIVRLAGNEDFVGFRGFGGQWIYPVSAIALTDTDLFFIPNKIFNMVLKANGEFSFFMLSLLMQELRRTEDMIKKLTYFEVKNRIAWAIFRLISVYGFEDSVTGKLSHTLSRKDFADMTGTTYESVVRTLNELNKKKIILIEGKTIRVLNYNALRLLAEPTGKP